VFIGKVQAEGQDKAKEEGSEESRSEHDCPAVTEAAPCWNSGTLCLYQCLPIWHTWVCTRCVSPPRRPPEWPTAHTSKYNSFDSFSWFTLSFISLKYVCLSSLFFSLPLGRHLGTSNEHIMTTGNNTAWSLQSSSWQSCEISPYHPHTALKKKRAFVFKYQVLVW